MRLNWGFRRSDRAERRIAPRVFEEPILDYSMRCNYSRFGMLVASPEHQRGLLIMHCQSCHSANQTAYPAEVNIHFPGLDGLEKPSVFVFPRLLVCLDCGYTQFTLSNIQLLQLKDPDLRWGQGIVA